MATIPQYRQVRTGAEIRHQQELRRDMYHPLSLVPSPPVNNFPKQTTGASETVDLVVLPSSPPSAPPAPKGPLRGVAMARQKRAFDDSDSGQETGGHSDGADPNERSLGDAPPTLLLDAQGVQDSIAAARRQLQGFSEQVRPLISYLMDTRKRHLQGAEYAVSVEEVRTGLAGLLADLAKTTDEVRCVVPFAGTGKGSSKRIALEDESSPEHSLGDLWCGAVETGFDAVVRHAMKAPSDQFFVCTADGPYYGRPTSDPCGFALKYLDRPMEDGDFKPQDAEWILENVRKHPKGREWPHTVCYTLYSPFCYDVNTAMRALGRSGTPPDQDSEFRRWRGFAFNLQRELLRRKPYTGVTFRASSVRFSSHQISPGSVTTLYAPTSSAAAPGAIKPFLGERRGKPYGTICVMHSRNGRYIAEESDTPWEEEVLHMAGRSFRLVPDKVGSGAKALLGHALMMDLSSVDIVEMRETRLLHWRDAVSAFSDYERERNPEVVNLIKKANAAFGGCVSETGLSQASALDPVTREEIKHRSGPMTRLPEGRVGPTSFHILHLAALKDNNASILHVLMHALPPSEINHPDALGRTCLHLAAGLPGNELAVAHILHRGGTIANLSSECAGAALGAAVQHLSLKQVTRCAQQLSPEAPGPRMFKNAVRAAAGRAREAITMPLIHCLADVMGGMQHLDFDGVLAAASSVAGCGTGVVVALHALAVSVSQQRAAGQGAPVACAVAAKNSKLISTLANCGCSVDAPLREHDRGPPLHVAVRVNDCDSVHVLIELKADVNATHNVGKNPWDEGTTALMLAAYLGRSDMISALLAAGADVNALNGYKQTSLHRAATAGHERCVQLLLANGSDPNAHDISHATPLYSACEGGHTDVVRALLANARIKTEVTADGQSPLHVASQCGHADTLACLLNHGADPNLSVRNTTPLALAANFGHTNVVAVLISAPGIDVNKPCPHYKNDTPLAIAQRKGHSQVVNLLSSIAGP